MTLVSERLGDGNFTTIDRPATMIKMANTRNQEFVSAGKAAVQTVSLGDAELDGSRYDTIFAIKVANLLRTRPAANLGIIREHLSLGGARTSDER